MHIFDFSHTFDNPNLELESVVYTVEDVQFSHR